MKVFIQDPDAKIDYPIDWTDYLETGETIASSAWSIEPTGPTIDNDSESDGVTVVYVSGLERGKRYRLSNQITTSNTPARTPERSVVIRAEHR